MSDGAEVRFAERLFESCFLGFTDGGQRKNLETNVFIDGLISVCLLDLQNVSVFNLTHD